MRHLIPFLASVAALDRETLCGNEPRERGPVCHIVENQSPSGQIISRTMAVTLPQLAVAATATASTTFSAPGAEVGSAVVISPSAALGTGLALSDARVSAANVVTYTLACVSAAATQASQTATCLVMKL